MGIMGAATKNGNYGTKMEEQASSGMPQNLDCAPATLTLFAELVNALHPGAGGRTIVKLLDGKARRTTILDWRSGRRGTPQWALDLLAAKLRAQGIERLTLAERASRAPPRPGLSAGAKNLAAWKARQNNGPK
jgi:hypothetical protein